MWPVSKWFGKGFPADAEWTAHPTALREMLDDHGVKWELQDLLFRLIERARQQRRDYLTDGQRALSKDWGVSRSVVAKRLAALNELGLIWYETGERGTTALIELEPARIALASWHGSLKSGSVPGHLAAIAARWRRSEPPVAPNAATSGRDPGHKWLSSEPVGGHRREKREEKSEETHARALRRQSPPHARASNPTEPETVDIVAMAERNRIRKAALNALNGDQL